MLSKPVLRPTKPPNQRVRGTLSLGVKRQGREADHSPPTCIEVNKTLIYTSTPPHAFIVYRLLVKHRDNYTFYETSLQPSLQQRAKSIVRCEYAVIRISGFSHLGSIVFKLQNLTSSPFNLSITVWNVPPTSCTYSILVTAQMICT
jgi:hypothetical protein